MVPKCRVRHVSDIGHGVISPARLMRSVLRVHPPRPPTLMLMLYGIETIRIPPGPFNFGTRGSHTTYEAASTFKLEISNRRRAGHVPRRRFEDRDRGACWGARTRRATAPTRVSLCTSFGRSPRSAPPPAGGRTGSPECGRKQPNNEARARGPGRRRGPAERPARGRTRRAVRAPAARGERRKPETTCQVRARQHT